MTARRVACLGLPTHGKAFGLLVSVQLARVELAQSFEVGLIQQTPVPNLTSSNDLNSRLADAWSLKRSLDTITETSPSCCRSPFAKSKANGLAC